jgi:PAS domain-containing protein
MKTRNDPTMLNPFIVQNAPIGICVFDRNDDLLLFNRSMEAILSVSSEDMLGKNLFRDLPACMLEGDSCLGQLYRDTKSSLKVSFK